MMSRTETAKAIRKELKAKFPDTKFSVRSSKTSVDIDWIGGPLTKDVRSVVGKYQAGHFDGMVDSYEYSNRRDDIPQVMYVMLQREREDEDIVLEVKEVKEKQATDRENLQMKFRPNRGKLYMGIRGDLSEDAAELADEGFDKKLRLLVNMINEEGKKGGSLDELVILEEGLKMFVDIKDKIAAAYVIGKMCEHNMGSRVGPVF